MRFVATAVALCLLTPHAEGKLSFSIETAKNEHVTFELQVGRRIALTGSLYMCRNIGAAEYAVRMRPILDEQTFAAWMKERDLCEAKIITPGIYWVKSFNGECSRIGFYDICALTLQSLDDNIRYEIVGERFATFSTQDTALP